MAYCSLHSHLKAQVVVSGHRFPVKRFQESVATWLVSGIAGRVRKSLGIMPKERSTWTHGAVSKALGSQCKRPVAGATWTDLPSKPL